MSTILDANITTLIASLLLFVFGSGPIRGFSITLSLGVLASMFTALMLTNFLVVFVFIYCFKKELFYIMFGLNKIIPVEPNINFLI